MTKNEYEELKIDVVDEVHGIREKLANASYGETERRAKKVLKELSEVKINSLNHPYVGRKFALSMEEWRAMILPIA